MTRPPAPARGPRRTPAAFTLVETIVVIVIISLLAGLIVPRLVAPASRQGAGEADAVRGLLGLVAQRASLGGQPAALAFDADAATLALLTGAADQGGAAVWTRSPLAPPVTLAAARIESFAVDGQVTAGGTSWRVEFLPGAPRPAVSLLLAAGDRAWQIDLDSGDLSAALLDLPSAGAWSPSPSRAVDLDAQGRRQTPW